MHATNAYIGDNYLSPALVFSGIIQGSVIGPGLYTIFINSMLHAILLPSSRYMQTTSNLSLTSPYTALLRSKQKLTRLCSGQMLTKLFSVLISAAFYIAVSKPKS